MGYSWTKLFQDEFGHKGAKQNFTLALIVMMFAGVFVFILPAPAAAGSWTDTTTENFAQGEHENTENVDNNVKLAGENIQGRFTSRVFDAGQVVENWDNIVWNVTLPTLTKHENDNVGIEPTTLVDDNSRIGTVVGGSLFDTSDNDGVYENIAEQEIATIPWPNPENIILLWDGATIPSGWVCISDDVGEPFYKRFPRGGPAYGVTGGQDNHTHTLSWVSCTGASPAGPVLDEVLGGVFVGDETHTHNTLSSYSVSVENNYPPYRSLKVIKYDGGAQVIPAGAIAIFDTVSVPSGWTLYTAQDDNFVMGDAVVALGNQYDTHTHSVSITTGPPATLDETAAGSGSSNSDTHTHNGSGPSSENINVPPYLEVVHAKANADTSIPDGIILMFDDTPSSPTYWTMVSDIGGDFYERFIVGKSTGYGGIGGSENHSHTDLAISVAAAATINIDAIPTNQAGCDSTHTHTVTVSFSTENHVPPYVDVIFAKSSKPTDYALRWEHRIENVGTGYDNYWVRVRGYTSGDSENVMVTIWNSNTSSWENIDNLTTTEKTITKYIAGLNISNYLMGDNISIKYEDYDKTDDSQTIVHVDLCIVQAENVYTTGIKFQVVTSADNSVWSDNLGPDGTTSTYFTTSPTSLENIGDNRYFKYIAYLSTEDNTITPVLHDVAINYTLPPIPLGKPVLYLPADGTVTNDNTPYFEWENGSNADNHRLLVDNDSDFSSPEENRIVPNNNYTIAGENSLSDDNYSWKVVAINAQGGNESATWTFVVDTQAPLITSVLINDDDLTSSTSVTLTIDATDATSGLAEMRFSSDNVEWSGWENFAASKSYTLPAGDGLKTVYVQVKDKAGWVSTVASDSITLETIPPPPPPALTVTIGTLRAGETGSADFTQYGIAVTKVRITAAGTVSNVRVDVVVHTAKPAGVTEPTLPAYSHLEISTTVGTAYIREATIGFQVPRSWMGQMNIDERAVQLLRYSGRWQRLSTGLVGADSTYLYYEATTPGFSVFAIVGERLVVPPPVEPTPPVTPSPVTPVTPPPTPPVAPVVPPPIQPPPFLYAVLFTMAGVVGFAAAYRLLVSPSKYYIMLKQLKRAVVRPKARRIGRPSVRLPVRMRRRMSPAELAVLRRLEHTMHERLNLR